MIHDAARRALSTDKPATAPVFETPIQIEVTFLTADMAEMSAWLHGVRLVEDRSRTVVLEGNDPLALFRTFVTIVALTRSLVE